MAPYRASRGADAERLTALLAVSARVASGAESKSLEESSCPTLFTSPSLHCTFTTIPSPSPIGEARFHGPYFQGLETVAIHPRNHPGGRVSASCAPALRKLSSCHSNGK